MEHDSLKCEMFLTLELKKKKSSGHWSQRYLRDKKNDEKIRWNWLALDKKPKPPCTVTLERIYNWHANQKDYDYDNLVTAFKGIRDTVADLLIPGLAPGQADHYSRGIRFLYLQTRGEIARVRITIEEEPYE